MSQKSPPPEDPDPSSTPHAQAPAVGSWTLADYQRLYAAMADAFGAIDLNGRFTTCNQRFADLVGYSVAELCEMNWLDLTPGEYHSEGLERLELIKQGEAFTFTSEKVYRRKDGTLVPVELRAFPLHDNAGRLTGFAWIVRDNSAHKAVTDHLQELNAGLQREVAEQTGRLEDTRESFRQLSEATHEGIVVSHEGIILKCNERFASMVGRKIGDMTGRPGTELVDPASQENMHQKILTGDEKPYELNLVRPDGSMIPVEIRARMVQTRDRLLRVSAVRDLSDIRRMESELEERHYGSAEIRQLANSLTPREREVVELVAQGMLNKEIADRLDVALITVKVHRGRAMRKLRAGNAAELGKIAIMAGIFKPR